ARRQRAPTVHGQLPDAVAAVQRRRPAAAQAQGTAGAGAGRRTAVVQGTGALERSQPRAVRALVGARLLRGRRRRRPRQRLRVGRGIGRLATRRRAAGGEAELPRRRRGSGARLPRRRLSLAQRFASGSAASTSNLRWMPDRLAWFGTQAMWLSMPRVANTGRISCWNCSTSSQ